jgi:hypothetical protein
MRTSGPRLNAGGPLSGAQGVAAPARVLPNSLLPCGLSRAMAAADIDVLPPRISTSSYAARWSIVLRRTHHQQTGQAVRGGRWG